MPKTQHIVHRLLKILVVPVICALAVAVYVSWPRSLPDYLVLPASGHDTEVHSWMSWNPQRGFFRQYYARTIASDDIRSVATDLFKRLESSGLRKCRSRFFLDWPEELEFENLEDYKPVFRDANRETLRKLVIQRPSSLFYLLKGKDLTLVQDVRRWGRNVANVPVKSSSLSPPIPLSFIAIKCDGVQAGVDNSSTMHEITYRLTPHEKGACVELWDVRYYDD